MKIKKIIVRLAFNFISFIILFLMNYEIQVDRDISFLVWQTACKSSLLYPIGAEHNCNIEWHTIKYNLFLKNCYKYNLELWVMNKGIQSSGQFQSPNIMLLSEFVTNACWSFTFRLTLDFFRLTLLSS